MYEGGDSSRSLPDDPSGHLLSSSRAPSPNPSTPVPSSLSYIGPSFMRYTSEASHTNSVTTLNSVGYKYHSAISRFQLPSDPKEWLAYQGPEADDIYHNPGKDGPRSAFISWRAVANLGCISLLMVGIIGLFAGYPIITFVTKHLSASASTTTEITNLRTNNTGQIPSMKGKFRLIDDDTPESAYTATSYNDGTAQLQLVFSDEFNTDGRTFYPGDDPFWEALDLNYWQTSDLEWYDPAAIMTNNGALEITFESKNTHGLQYQGGMMATWNKFCFTGGIIEVAVMLPGSPTISGFWPAVWTMGNLGRVGYGATTDGLWPYSYDACDYGTVPNQTFNGQPAGALQAGIGDIYHDDAFSYLPGQRLSRCTCPGADHPGPRHEDGSYVGRASPEIDLFEATASSSGGNLSQSLQIAPYDPSYYFHNGTGTYSIHLNTTTINTYHGGAYQESVSALTMGNQNCYQNVDQCYTILGIEYKPGYDDAYITWVSNNQTTWTVNAAAIAANDQVGISDRPITQEPMYLIMNLGMSTSFQAVSDALQLPGKMRIDYIRVYQRPDSINVGCDPEAFPTMDYISKFNNAYTNPNYTIWSDAGYSFPGNSFMGQC